jgi:tetratricopeptide (TPR) repeat protein
LALLALGCGSDAEKGRPRVPVTAGPTIDAGATTTPWSGESRYYEGYLAETMRGDLAAARKAYRQVLERSSGSDSVVAARAALRLAEIEALSGRRRNALELVARAQVLGRDDVQVVTRADRLQARLASIRSRGSEVRGPPAGVALPGVSNEVAARFAAAEKALAAYHRMRLSPRSAALQGGVYAKERSMHAAVREYRRVIELGDIAATCASEFRIGALYHDLAISLTFDLPPELEPHAAAKLRRSLRARALGYLRKARASYQQALASALRAGSSAEIGRWRRATELGMAAVVDILGGRQ